MKCKDPSIWHAVTGGTLVVVVCILTAAVSGCATKPPPPHGWNCYTGKCFYPEDQKTLDEAKAKRDEAAKAASACSEQLKEDPRYEAIRGKVELIRKTGDPLPFSVATNQNRPSNVEAGVIAAWATNRQQCWESGRKARVILPFTNRNAAQFQSQMFEIDRGVAAQVDALIIALYQGKLTYAEFGEHRVAVDDDSRKIKMDLIAAANAADNARDAHAHEEAVENARQAYAARTQAWSAYMASINSRPVTNVVVQQQQQQMIVH